MALGMLWALEMPLCPSGPTPGMILMESELGVGLTLKIGYFQDLAVLP